MLPLLFTAPPAITAAGVVAPSSLAMTPKGRASKSSSPKASQKTAPAKKIATNELPLVAPLSEPHSYQLQSDREWNRHSDYILAGFGRLVSAFAWPVVAIWAFILAAKTLQTNFGKGSATKNDGFPPLPIANQSIAVAAQDQQDAQRNATTIAAAFKGFPVNPTPLMVMEQNIPVTLAVNDRAAARNARISVELYFARAFSSILATQLQLLRAAAIRTLTYADAKALYQVALSREYTGSFLEWMDFLVRFAMIDRAAAAPLMATTVSINNLGRLFLGWCDREGFTEQTLVAQGRRF